MKNKLSLFGVLLALLSLGISRADTTVNLPITDFVVIPPTFKAISAWWCPPDVVYSSCQACISVAGYAANQGPVGVGECQSGASGLELFPIYPAVPYEHCGGSGNCGPGQGSFCESIANSATKVYGGGGGAAGGCWAFVPNSPQVENTSITQGSVIITKRWHARLRHGKWHCKGDCDVFKGH